MAKLMTMDKPKRCRKQKEHLGIIGMFGLLMQEGKNDWQYQFQIVRSMGDGRYVCQMFSALDGEPTNCMILSDLETSDQYRLYADAELWREASGEMSRRYWNERNRERELRRQSEKGLTD
jgi:hypothetical protein